ncbi:hypothetical protein [Rosistilla oblonga]|uniref:hypothetical protein n=1 Tax=Rosistilla oblonga TaxID=2527990 RepID=UPI003A96D536
MSNSDTGDSSAAARSTIEKIRSAETLAQLMPIFDDIENSRTIDDTTKFWELCSEFFFRVKVLFDPAADTVAVQREIASRLVALSLEDVSKLEPESSGRRRDCQYVQYELRRTLKKVMRQIEVSERWHLLRELEDELCGRLLKEPTDTVFATVSTIGMRTDAFTDALWRVARSGAAMAESAICTIIDLGVPTVEKGGDRNQRSELITLGRTKLKNDEFQAVKHIVWYLCGPDGMDLVLDALAKAEGIEDRAFHVDMIFSGAAHAIDRCDVSSPFHQQVWDVFRRNKATINMNASFAFGCQSPEPIRDYLDWLVEDSSEGNHDIQFSVTKSRISELFKPQHLDGFDLVDANRIVPALKQIAIKDSGITGRLVTPSLDAKTSSIQWLQCLGVEDFDDLSTSIILKETNPYVAHRVAELLSASAQSRFAQVLCEQIESAAELDVDDNENFFRQSAAIQLAHASETRKAFCAMTKFGYLHRGNVLLSVIDALSDLAIARLSAGDQDVYELILGMNSKNAPQHHREAGVATLCRLVSNGDVDSNVANRLWEFVDDQTLDAFSRASCLVVLGSPGVAADDQQLQWLREKAFSSDFDQQPDAFEGLLLRNGISIGEYSQAAEFLGCTYTDGKFQTKEPGEVSAWQAHMLAHLYRAEPNRAVGAIESILGFASSESVHQITWAIEERGSNQPATVVEQLRNRVLLSNTRGRADTDLIRTLGVVSSDLITEIILSGAWCNWLEPGRLALVENARLSEEGDLVSSETAREIYAAFISDPSFQVRRAAYRQFARLNPGAFALYLEVLSTSTEPELLSRAAEGIRWLPSNQFDDDFIRGAGLDSHPLPEIREIAKDAIIERRNREWCDHYIGEIEAAVRDNRLAAREFRLGLAIETIGDDETLERLGLMMTESVVKPRIRFWLKGLRKAVEKQWKKTLGQSAKPWSFLRGSVQMLEGKLYLGELDKEFAATVHLWKHERKSLSEKYSWGGILEPLAGTAADFFELSEAELRFPDRQSCQIHVSGSTWSSSHNVRLSFFSNSPWPEERAAGRGHA